MYLDSSPDIQDGELRAHVNPGDGSPWAVICFAPHVRLADLSLDDCDRIIRAAVNAKRRLSAALAGQAHEYRDAADDQGHCDACGLLSTGAVHASIASDEAAAVLAASIASGQPVITEDDEAPTQQEIDRCGYSEDPYHRCRVCYDYAAEREREHPLSMRLGPVTP